MKDFSYAILGVIVGASLAFLIEGPSGSLEIRSKTPIDPELHIVVVQDSLDTTFVYKKP